MAPGEASGAGALTARRGAGTAVVVEYTPACAATDHVVYLGQGPISGAIEWTAATCGLGTDGLASFDPGDPAPGGLYYFVIVGQNMTSEGSYGESSTGTERPEAIGVGDCDVAREIGADCTQTRVSTTRATR